MSKYAIIKWEKTFNITFFILRTLPIHKIRDKAKHCVPIREITQMDKGNQSRFLEWERAKYDIRAWSQDYTNMGKSVVLTLDELTALRDVLNGLIEPW